MPREKAMLAYTADREGKIAAEKILEKSSSANKLRRNPLHYFFSSGMRKRRTIRTGTETKFNRLCSRKII